MAAEGPGGETGTEVELGVVLLSLFLSPFGAGKKEHAHKMLSSWLVSVTWHWLPLPALTPAALHCRGDKL